MLSVLEGHRLIGRLVQALYPADCPACGRPCDSLSSAPICRGCWSGLTRYRGPACSICAKPLSSPFAKTCSDCLLKPPAFSRIESFGLYDGVLAAAINLFKFREIRRLAGPLGSLLLDLDLSGADVVVPVPLTPNRLRERGFNQSLLIGKVIADRTRRPFVIDGLLKVADTPPPDGASRKGAAVESPERLQNIPGIHRPAGPSRRRCRNDRRNGRTVRPAAPQGRRSKCCCCKPRAGWTSVGSRGRLIRCVPELTPDGQVRRPSPQGERET